MIIIVKSMFCLDQRIVQILLSFRYVLLSVFFGPIVITFNGLYCLMNQIFFFFRTALESDEEWSSEDEDDDDDGCECQNCQPKRNGLMHE
jgi:hypothetical protein